MYVSPPSAEPADYGLGIWGTVAMIGGTLATRWIAGGGDDIPNDVYYPQAKIGVVHCPGPWDVGALRVAIENNPSDPIGARIDQYFVSGVLERDADKWARYGRPRTPLEKAGALVAEAHGGSDCQGGAESATADALISRMLETERARQSTLAGQLSDVVSGGQAAIGDIPEVVPGVNTGLLLGVGALAFFALRS